MKKSIIVLFFSIYCCTCIYAQKIISGYVYNNSVKPLSYASVFISNKPNIGTFTDEKGFFLLKVDTTDILFISHIGYESTKITVTDFKNQVIFNMTAKYHIC